MCSAGAGGVTVRDRRAEGSSLQQAVRRHAPATLPSFDLFVYSWEEAQLKGGDWYAKGGSKHWGQDVRAR